MRFVALLSFSVISSLAAFGQAANGTITGTVTDPAGAVVANAPIQARMPALASYIRRPPQAPAITHSRSCRSAPTKFP